MKQLTLKTITHDANFAEGNRTTDLIKADKPHDPSQRKAETWFT
jgi:hypothetical protein